MGSNILADAANELVLNGWVQTTLGTVDGPKCALGALSYAYGGDDAGRVCGGKRYMRWPSNLDSEELDEAVKFLARRVNPKAVAHREHFSGSLSLADAENIVEEWNDALGVTRPRTAEEVRDALLSAAVAWEAEKRSVPSATVTVDVKVSD